MIIINNSKIKDISYFIYIQKILYFFLLLLMWLLGIHNSQLLYSCNFITTKKLLVFSPSSTFSLTSF